MLIERMQGERDKWLAAINTIFGYIEGMISSSVSMLVQCIRCDSLKYVSLDFESFLTLQNLG
ncbi:hypothetical protein Ahy_B09g095247 [Arachis hypogaea]|uniref:Uncharacterized protein n=1 Tax=Arachis hypogaea TaxID=3818 RepID=A0A444XDP5_ARAHY|nr:hypothetical protein Ahy_B09g095247 [Arachis hypogaea]